MKQIVIVLLICGLSGCGGYHKAKRDMGAPSRAISAPVAITPTAAGVTTPAIAAAASADVRATPLAQPVRKPAARGPIQRACMTSGRKARSRELCGCIQAVADETLSGAQQRRAAGFYSDPHSAQEVRQSPRASDADFWTTYRAYGDRADRVCR